MSGERIDLKPFQTGNFTFAGVEQAGLVYRLSPVERRDVIVIGNLPKNTIKTVDLSTQLEHDILITGISADIVNDDSKTIQEGKTNNYSFYYVQTILQVLDRNTQNVIRTTALFLSGYTPNVGEFILTPKYLYAVKTNLDVATITITGKPVYVSTPIVFL